MLQIPRPLSGGEQRIVAAKIKELGPWFHNMNLTGDLWTNPTWEGSGPDYPLVRWQVIEPVLPAVRGMNCLDIGCSSGFFSLKLKELGASHVLGIDHGEQDRAIAQAKFAAKTVGYDIDFRDLSVYDLPSTGTTFDVVLFMGVFYHLRHPMLALDAVRAVAKNHMVFQTITTRHKQSGHQREWIDCPAGARDAQLKSDLIGKDAPVLRYVEGALDGDDSCWFVPSAEAVLSMLRSAGFEPQKMVFPSETEVIVLCSIARPQQG
jgi:tRNA (mo5U34)-methyltransferase